jgi:hypothetical protein
MPTSPAISSRSPCQRNATDPRSDRACEPHGARWRSAAFAIRDVRSIRTGSIRSCGRQTKRYAVLGKRPGDLDFISRGWVVAVAAILYLVEFLADKIPVVDSIWDAIHTLIRVPTGAVLAASAFAHFDPAIRVVALLAGVRSRSALMGPRPGPRPASA